MGKAMQWLLGLIEWIMPKIVNWLEDYGWIIGVVLWCIALIGRFIQRAHDNGYRRMWEEELEEDDGEMGK